MPLSKIGCPDSIINIAILPKLTYELNIIPIKILALSVEIDKVILKYIQKYKGSRITKTTLKRTNLEDLFYLISGLTIKLQ